MSKCGPQASLISRRPPVSRAHPENISRAKTVRGRARWRRLCSRTAAGAAGGGLGAAVGVWSSNAHFTSSQPLTITAAGISSLVTSE
eukprot:14661079-Heterocapsa_arctica.AAC.1